MRKVITLLASTENDNNAGKEQDLRFFLMEKIVEW